MKKMSKIKKFNNNKKLYKELSNKIFSISKIVSINKILITI